MIISELTATADLIGRRVRLSWSVTPEDADGVDPLPAVTVRRKRRDFAFPPTGLADPYLLYDSSDFPPTAPDVLAVDLPSRDLPEGPSLVREQATTVVWQLDGRRQELMRRTTRDVLGPDRRLLRQEVELVDVGGVRLPELLPGETYYYELSSPILTGADSDRYRATAMPGEAYGLGRQLYTMIPEIYRRNDTVVRVPDPGTGNLPEAAAGAAGGGQLRRMTDVFGASLDALRSSAEGLWTLHDSAKADPRFLPLLATWIGWDLTTAAEVSGQRNEIVSAPRLYESVGTILGLRTIVDHYTGWSTRVAEFQQHIARTNLPAQHNIFGLVNRGGTWFGIDDAAPKLGFAPPNSESVGGGGVAAQLIGGVPGPYSLDPGMRLTVSVDGGLAVQATFGPADFDDIGAASAAEVAQVLDSLLSEAGLGTLGSAVRIRSLRSYDPSRVEIRPAGASLVSLEGAPTGRLSMLLDSRQRLWMAHASTVGPEPGAEPRLVTKTFVRDRWRDGHDVDPQERVPQADPALVPLAVDVLGLAWVDRPVSDRSELRWRHGVVGAPTKAQMVGATRPPFDLTVGTKMVITGYGATETFEVKAADYAAPGIASAAEVVAAMNAQLVGVTAGVAAHDCIVLKTAAEGPGIRLFVDLPASTAARALGFGDPALTGSGGWTEEVAWGASTPVLNVGFGRHGGCTAAVTPDGSVRLFWTTQRARRKRIVRSRWDDRILACTSLGVASRKLGEPLWAVTASAAGLPDDDVRDVVVDGDGTTWYATAAGGARRTSNGAVTVLDNASTAGGLKDDDVRSVTVARDGATWFAHAVGVSMLDAGGAWQTFQQAPAGLASDDVRHVAAAADGGTWFATAAGLSMRDEHGRWTTWKVADGLASDDVRHVFVSAPGVVWAATAAGLSRLGPGDPLVSLRPTLLGGEAGSDDVRAVVQRRDAASESVWAATAAGVIELRTQRRAVTHGMVEGLPSQDCRSILETPDGTMWVGTAAGLSRRPPGGSGWLTETTVDGLPANVVGLIHGPWSMPLEFPPSAGGDSDPHVVLDGADLRLTWASRQSANDPSDTWLLKTRRFSSPASSWQPPIDVTVLAGPRVCDREPHLLPLPGGSARVHFRSDRAGGTRLWSVDLDAADVASAPTQVTTDEAGDFSPAALRWPDGREWLLFGSDRSVPMGRLGGGVPTPEGQGDTSRRAGDEASLRRFTGTTTVLLSDVHRHSRRRQFADLLSYTPQKPGGLAEGALRPDEVFTRGTIGLYVERGPGGRQLAVSEVERLRQLLDRFTPVNLRCVIVLRPSDVPVEKVYPPGPTDSYFDVFPLVEVLTGPTDETGVVLPDWLLFMSTEPTSLTANPADLTTLRRRTFQPPPL